MDINFPLRKEQPAPLTAKSTNYVKRDFERWDGSNHMCLMIMKHNILEAFRGIESVKITQANGFLDKIEKHFAKNDKVLIPIIDQEVNLEPQQDNVEQLPIQDKLVVPEKQARQPQE
ncbi:hypothetical protein J1N35_043444 [Gossypium stocksii]|uniref:Uncharacterized protein n=1 Tax=Gossypium stocksii TaxID=47602 RepID=A0A9D3U796_9ROSI|nr:hypothetical protein J1N35_043444 [Gossypium stocksii]